MTDVSGMDTIEALQAVRGLAQMAAAMHLELVEQGFGHADALRLVGAWMAGAWTTPAQ